MKKILWTFLLCFVLASCEKAGEEKTPPPPEPAKKETVFDESFIKNGIYKPLYGVSETLSDGSIVLAAESAVLLFADVFTPSDNAILL